MNLVILEPGESGASLPRGDRRYEHIVRILKKKEGDSVTAGLTDGSLGTARIARLDAEALVLVFEGGAPAPALHRVRILMGFPRPIQAGRLLKDLASLGVERIWFALSELGEKSYAESDFFSKGDFSRNLAEGAEQAGNPRLPEVRRFWSLERALDALDASDATDAADAPLSPLVGRIYFHPDPAARRLSDIAVDAPLWLAIGSERGWTERETATLAGRGFAAATLGPRILKTETAAVAATALALAKLGIL